MRNIIYSLIAIVTMTSMSFAQDMNTVANSNGKKALIESKENGTFEFHFATERTKESVDKAASYYVSNFTVEFDESTNIATVKLIENDVTSRAIVSRFLAVNQIRLIEVDGDMVSISDFIENYLK